MQFPNNINQRVPSRSLLRNKLQINLPKSISQEPLREPHHKQRVRVASASKNRVFINKLKSHRSALQYIQILPHVPIPQLNQGVKSVFGHVQLFMLSNKLDPDPGELSRQGHEPEPCAATLQGGDDFGHVIADEAKTGRFRVLFYYAAQSELRGVRHRVSFVEDYEFDALGHDLLRACEVFYLLADHVDPAVVRGVELETH